MPKVEPSKGRKEPPSDAAAGFSHIRALPERLRQYDQRRQLISQSLGPLTAPQGKGKTTATPPITSFTGPISNHDARSEDFDSFRAEANKLMEEPLVEYKDLETDTDRQAKSQKDTHSRTANTTVDSSSTGMSVPDASSWPDSYYNSSYSPAVYNELTIPTTTGTVQPPHPGVHRLLPCEFVGYASCGRYFYPEDADQWIEHIIVDHLRNRLPSKSACWYCDDHDFDASRDGDRMTHFRNRLDHIRTHIRDEGLGVNDIRPDYAFIAHIEKLGLIAQPVFEEAQSWQEGPVSGVTGIYPHNWEPPERQQQYGQSQTMVINEKPRGRKSNKHSDGHKRRHWGHGHHDKFDSSSRTAQNKPESQQPLNSVIPAAANPGMFHEDGSPLSVNTLKHQQAVMTESCKLEPEDLKREQLSPCRTTDSTDELLGNLQQQSNFDETPRQENQDQLHSTSGMMREQSLTLPQNHMPPTTTEENEVNDSHQTIQRTSESYPSSPSIFFSAVEIPSRLDEADAPHDANTLTHPRQSLAESSQPELEGPKSMQLSPSSTDELPTDHESQSSDDRILLTRPIQTPESSDITMSESSTTYQEGNVSNPPLSTRQVGLVRVRIERLTIFNHCLADSDSGDDLDEEADVTEDEHGEDVTELESGSTDHQEPGESSSTSPKESRSSSKRLNRDTGEAHEGESDEEQNDRRKGPDRKRKKAVCTEQPLRFACPYQAYESFQDCLKQGPRNPRGGCAGINRLKQHLSRRHMESYRCQRCWGVFDSRRKAIEHEEQETQCSSREKPPSETFMAHEQEAEIETACRSVSAEEAWWNLFRLLIPGMQNRDILSLMLDYCPYYINRQPTFIIPSLTVSNISFEPAPQATSNAQEAMHNTTSAAPNPSSSHGRTFNIPSTPFEIQPEGSQTVAIPLLEVLDSAAADNSFPTVLRTTGMGTSNQLNLNSGSSSSSDNSAESLTPGTVFEALGFPEMSSNNEAQQIRNHERLRDRNRQSEANIAALRRNMHGTLEDLNHADNLVEDLLSLGNLTDVMYDKLASLSSVLGSARKKLQ